LALVLRQGWIVEGDFYSNYGGWRRLKEGRFYNKDSLWWRDGIWRMKSGEGIFISVLSGMSETGRKSCSMMMFGRTMKS